MADLTITAANVKPGTNARLDRNGYAGETITQGMPVYKAADGTWMKADSNSATPLARVAKGIAMNGASQYQPIDVLLPGDGVTFFPGSTLVANIEYYLSDTPGGICPLADVGTGEYKQLIGIAISTTEMKLSLLNTGVAN